LPFSFLIVVSFLDLWSFISATGNGINIAEEMDMVAFLIKCGAEGTRTPDFLRAKEALSQLSYSPI
jgi:hypothetical protein